MTLTSYEGREFHAGDWITHIDRLRGAGFLTVGEWHGYIVGPGSDFGPHRGPFYVLIPWRRDGNMIAVAHTDPDEAVQLADRLEVEL